MHRLFTFFMTIGILSLLLTACGTSTGSENTNGSANPSDPAEEQVEQTDTNKDGDTEKNAKENDDSNQNNDMEKENNEVLNHNDSETDIQPAKEHKLSYKINGETIAENALLKKSDNQDFSLYVLPAYELTAEEPNKDSLFLKENDRVFMRIELLPSDTNKTSLKENTITQLKVVNEDVQTLTPPADDMLKNATILEAAKDGEMVTAYLIEQKEAIIKLTLFTTEQADHRDAFIQMAKTIKAGIVTE